MSGVNQFIKKPNALIPYTEEQEQMLLACMDPATGPLHFIKNFVYIQHPTKGRMLFKPFDYQLQLIDHFHKYRFLISMLSRQTGKTTCASAYLLWYAMFIPDSQILIAAHKYSGAQEIMNRVRFAYEHVPDFIRAGVVDYNKGSIAFDNGSRIKAETTTETTGRGMSLSLLFADEFAFVDPPYKAREFWTSLSPTLSTGGKAILCSTPNSDEDQFATIWREANKTVDEYGNERELGANGFKAYKAHWREHPDRDDKWADEEKSRIGEERFRREHELEFIAYDELLINSIFLNSLVGKDPIEKTGQIRWYKRPTPGHTYIVALDPSLGTGGDPSAIQVLELPNFEQVGEWQHNKTTIPGQIKLLREICKHIHSHAQGSEIFWSVENNTIGEAALVSIMEMGEENIPGTFLSEPRKGQSSVKYRRGFTTTNKEKLNVCSKFKNMLEGGKLKINSKNLVKEIKNFVAVGNTYKAKPGENDDLVMSFMLALRMTGILATWDTNVFDKMKEKFDEDNAPMPIFIVRNQLSRLNIA